MITGDNSLTACQVATELAIATKPILILNEQSSNWISIDEQTVIPAHSSSMKDLFKDYDFCVSGASFALFMNTPALKKNLADVAVWARVSPDQKVTSNAS
jgi:cation-transporting ATPase 13A1